MSSGKEGRPEESGGQAACSDVQIQMALVVVRYEISSTCADY